MERRTNTHRLSPQDREYSQAWIEMFSLDAGMLGLHIELRCSLVEICFHIETCNRKCDLDRVYVRSLRRYDNRELTESLSAGVLTQM